MPGRRGPARTFSRLPSAFARSRSGGSGKASLKCKKRANSKGRGGDRKSKSTPSTLKLRDLAISKDESAQAQEFASVAEETFERMLGEAGSGELSERALLRRIRATKTKTATSTSNIDKPSGGDESAPTVPGRSAGPIFAGGTRRSRLRRARAGRRWI